MTYVVYRPTLYRFTEYLTRPSIGYSVTNSLDRVLIYGTESSSVGSNVYEDPLCDSTCRVRY